MRTGPSGRSGPSERSGRSGLPSFPVIRVPQDRHFRSPQDRQKDRLHERPKTAHIGSIAAQDRQHRFQVRPKTANIGFKCCPRPTT